jgi:hypothetical protein
MKALYAQRQHEHQQQLELSHKQQQEEEEETARYYHHFLQSLASETTNTNASITSLPSMKRTSSSTKNARVDFAGSITTSSSDEDEEKESSSSSLWKNLSTSLRSAPSPSVSALTNITTTTTTTNRSSLASKNARSHVMDQQQNTPQQQQQQPPPPLRYSSGESSSEMKTSVPEMRNSLLQGRPLSTVREGMTKEVSTNSLPPPTKQTVPATTSSSAKTSRGRRPAPPTRPPPPEPTLTFWQKQRERILKKWRKPPKYRLLKLCQLLCGAYIVLMSFTFVGTLGDIGGLVDPDSGWIIDTTSTENTNKGVILINGDFRAIVAQTDFQMIALAISRLSAFTMYPGMSNMIAVKSVIVFVHVKKYHKHSRFDDS